MDRIFRIHEQSFEEVASLYQVVEARDPAIAKLCRKFFQKYLEKNLFENRQLFEKAASRLKGLKASYRTKFF